MYRLEHTGMTRKDNSQGTVSFQGRVCVHYSVLLLWLDKQWLVVNVCSLVTASILTPIIHHHGTAQTGDIQDDRGIDARY